MEFPFGRQTSRDFIFNKADKARKALTSAKASVTEGSSSMLDWTKNGIGGISDKFDQLVTGEKEGEEEGDGADGVGHTERRVSGGGAVGETRAEGAGIAGGGGGGRMSEKPRPLKRADSKPGPPRPPPPSGAVGMGAGGGGGGGGKPRGSANGSVRQLARQHTAPVGREPPHGADPIVGPGSSSGSGGSANRAINFDEPLYGRQKSPAASTHIGNYGQTSSALSDANSNRRRSEDGTGYVPQDSPHASGRSRNPFLESDHSSSVTSAEKDPVSTAAAVRTRAEVHSALQYGSPSEATDYSTTASAPSDYSNVHRSSTGQRQEAMNYRDQQYHGTVPQGALHQTGLGSDLLPGIPSVPSSDGNSLGPQQGGRDLLAITPTTREALPMPDLEPTRQGNGEINDDSDGDSEATEGCDEVQDPRDYEMEGDYDGPMFRSGSVGSDKSWNSQLCNDSHMDELARECMDFMKEFVSKIFDSNSGVTQADKARFGELCQNEAGRLWFARYVNAQRVHNKNVDEHIFYQLVQYFAVALFECNEAEDYGPAKTLMNMCFTFYHEVQQPVGPVQKYFLYSFLKEQHIWQSLRFWNASFFGAVQQERARRPTAPPSGDTQARRDDREYQENIVFGQLGTFTCNMRAFGLSKELCLEFLRKQSSIANLRDEQIRVLRENVERYTEQYPQ